MRWANKEFKTRSIPANRNSCIFYGRASLLSGNTDEAAKAFEATIAKVNNNPSPENMTLRKEATLGLAAAALKSEKDKPAAQTHFDEIIQKPAATISPVVSQPTP